MAHSCADASSGNRIEPKCDPGFAARYRLPAVYPFRYFAQGGGLVSYGIDQVNHFRRAADYINRILYRLHNGLNRKLGVN